MRRVLACIDLSLSSHAVIAGARDLATPDGKLFILHVAAPDPDFVGFEAGSGERKSEPRIGTSNKSSPTFAPFRRRGAWAATGPRSAFWPVARRRYGKGMEQLARVLTDPVDGFLRRARYLIHDCDPLFTARFADVLRAADVSTVKLPPRSPDLNAFDERRALGQTRVPPEGNPARPSAPAEDRRRVRRALPPRAEPPGARQRADRPPQLWSTYRRHQHVPGAARRDAQVL